MCSVAHKIKSKKIFEIRMENTIKAKMCIIGITGARLYNVTMVNNLNTAQHSSAVRIFRFVQK